MRFIAFFLPAMMGFSLPQLSLTSEGQANLHYLPDRLEIEVPDQANLIWEQFNIEKSETTRFLQPNSQSIAVNRVLDSAPSRIMGRLDANGTIFLMNPNGILVGKDAIIDTGSFLATTLDLQDRCFESSKEFKFSSTSTSPVINYGRVQTRLGAAVFIGREVENHGTIYAEDYAALFAGNDVVLWEDTDVPFEFKIQANESLEGFSLCSNSGSIKGSNAYLLGERVWLQKDSEINTSHLHTPGTILIGGDFQGKNPNIENASKIYFDLGAKVFSDAIEFGNGGKIILWSEESTLAYGDLSCRGGISSGDGGFIEVSSHKMLDFQGTACTLAPNGNAGMLLLDPLDLSIQSAGVDTFVTGASPFSPTGGACGAGNAILTTGTLGTALTGGNVTVETTGTVGACPGDVFIRSTFSWANANSLTINAANDIIVSSGADISATDGDLNLNAVGDITIPVTSDITVTGSGNTTLSATNMDIRGSIQNTGGVGSSGNVVLIAPNGGEIYITHSTAPLGVGSQNGTTSVGDLTLPFCQRSRPNVTLEGGPSGAGGCNLGYIFPASAVSFTATGPIEVVCSNLNVLGSVGVSQGSASVGHTTQGGPPSSTNSMTTATATITVDAAQNINITGGATFNSGWIGHGGRFQAGATSTFRGDICVNAGGSILIEKVANSGFGSAGIGHGTISLNTGGVNASANVTVQALGDITLRNNSTTTVNGTYSGSFIGHASGIGLSRTRTGNIYVFCGGNLTMESVFSAATTRNNSVLIGHSAFDAYDFLTSSLSNANSNIYVSVGGDLSILANSSGANGIGTIARNTTGSAPNGVVQILVGGNFSVESGSGSSLSPVNVGSIFGVTPSLTADTNIAVNGDITITPNGIGQSIFFTAYNDMNLACGDSLTLTGSGTATTPLIANGQSYISTSSPDVGSTRIRVGSDITVNLGSLGIPMLIGTTSAPPTIPPLLTTGSLSVEAAGALTILNGFRTTSGTIYLATGVPFSSGDLWTVAADQLTSLAGQPLSALPFSACSLCSPLLSAPLVDSASVAPGCACSAFNSTDVNGNIFQTDLGDLSLISPRCTFCCPSSAIIGPLTGSDSINLQTTSGNVTISMFENITVNTAMSGNNFLFLACEDINFTSIGSITALGDVDLVADNAFPNSPLFGDGAFSMDAGSFINSAGYLRIYSSMQQLNSVFGLLNGFSFTPGPLFENTSRELWCTYYPTPLNGFPFSISYKDCLEEIVAEAEPIIVQMNVDLHPYNEFPGWMERFTIKYLESTFEPEAESYYYIRRRHLNTINQPKTWTVYLPE